MIDKIKQPEKNYQEKLFGTDGIRGIANQYPMTPEMALKIGRAAALFCQRRNASRPSRIVIGRDTRQSGNMIEYSLISGICSMGVDVFSAAILPTPAIAFLSRQFKANAGIVVSASHNPYTDNGIKFFSAKGLKLSETEEAEIERDIRTDGVPMASAGSSEIGVVHPVENAQKLYADFLKSTIRDTAADFRGISVAMDCANGATYRLAPSIFSELGAKVLPMAVSPNGMNINEDCGSQYPEKLAAKVVESGFDMGVAFDGDGDRLIAVDETGSILTGDQILAIFANYYLKNGWLKNKTVVSTIMSNIGLGKTLSGMNVHHIESDVGDRHVMQRMMASDAVLGGEDSGHLILLHHQTTGDGILAALQLLSIMKLEKKPLSELASVMTVYPQTLKNLEVGSKPPLNEIPAIKAAIAETEAALNGNGRVLVRYSGTQPVCRVMVEASTQEEADSHCIQLVEIIGRCLGKSA
jgi:phosphoglucosamine mutase